MPRPYLSESSSKWPWWCCKKVTYKIRRMGRKVEKRQWTKEAERENPYSAERWNRDA